MESFDDGMLTIHRTQSPGLILLDWRGRSNGRTPVVSLAPFFDAVAADAKAGGAAIEMYFAALEELNSSTMTAIIHLIQKLKKLEVRLALVYDANLKWQKICFQALRVFQKAGARFEIRESSSPGSARPGP